MSKQEPHAPVDFSEAATGEARTAEEVFAVAATPIRVVFWDGARGQRVVDERITNDDVSVAVGNSGYLWIREIASRNVTIFASGGGSVVKIRNLECDTLVIYAGYNSRVELENVTVRESCYIDIHYTSQLWLDSGFMKSIAGQISYSSTGCHKSGMTFGREDVVTSHGSSWTSFCL